MATTIHSVLKRYSGTEWVPVHLESDAALTKRANGHTVESDLSNFLPEATGTNTGPVAATMGKLYTDNTGKVYSSTVDGVVVPQATEQFVRDNAYVLPNVPQKDTNSVESPTVGGKTVVVDSVTRDANGRVTAINLKTITLPTQKDVAGNAGTATKLKAGAKIGATGGVTAAPVQFDGSTDINLEVTAIDPSKLSGPVDVTKGGTGAATFTAGEVLVGNGVKAVTTKGIDTAPTKASQNLITSDAVAKALEGKSSNITGAASTVVSSDLTADRAVISDGTGKLAVSSVTTTELGHLSGVKSAIQTQLDLLAPKADPSFTGKPTAPTAPVGDDSTTLATTAYVIAAVNNLLNMKNAFRLVGTLNPTTDTLPKANAGDVYRFTADGTINGLTVHENDTATCAVDDTPAGTPANWYITHVNHDGMVFGPASSVDKHVATFDGSSGNRLADSGFTIAASVPANAKFTDTVYTHPKSGVTANAYGPAAGATLAFGGKFVIPQITVDADGHVTVAAARDFTLPAAPTNVESANKLATARKVTFTKGATGSFTFDGSGDVSCELTVEGGGGVSYVQSASQPAAGAQKAGDFWEVPL